jgi:hypothetical protein
VKGLKMFEKIALGFAAVFLIAVIIYQFENPTPVKKSCQFAEISPDFTIQEREMCRRMREK